MGKLGRGGTKDELAKPLIAVQRVQLPPDESRADRSVVSVAIHRVTGACEAYTTRMLFKAVILLVMLAEQDSAALPITGT